MAVLKITKYGEPVLRKKAQPVQDLGPETQHLILDMYETMYMAQGIGLAAPQIGLSLRLAVINVTPDQKKNQFVIINPRTVKREGKVESEEGCLSLPGLEALFLNDPPEWWWRLSTKKDCPSPLPERVSWPAASNTRLITWTEP